MTPTLSQNLKVYSVCHILLSLTTLTTGICCHDNQGVQLSIH